MGRRARTNNCSPVDSALEKYHSDIGNRLSGIFISPNNDDQTCDAFNMLTLDFRGKHFVKHAAMTCQQPSTTTRSNNTDSKDDNNNKDTTILEESDIHKDDSPFDQASSTTTTETLCKRSDTLSSFNSQPNDFVSIKEKRNIVDKLARAIFQRKHTCARCQRRSRSCLQNKTTFNVREKHYTCAYCRETSKAIKNLVIAGQDHTKLTNGEGVDLAKNNADIILNKPRVYLKDSGYETVTSCSTVASAHSNPNSPYISSNRQHTDTSATTTAPPCLRLTPDEEDGDDELIRKDNRVTPCSALKGFVSGHDEGTHDGRTPHSTDNTTTQTSYANPNKHNHNHAGLENYLGVVGDDGCRALKQVKTRFVQNYDGYLPDQEINSAPCDVILQSNNSHGTTDHYHNNTTNNQQNNSNSNNDNQNRNTTSTTTPKLTSKMCHMCATTLRPCFRLPWEGGWLCEDCIDGML